MWVYNTVEQVGVSDGICCQKISIKAKIIVDTMYSFDTVDGDQSLMHLTVRCQREKVEDAKEVCR